MEKKEKETKMVRSMSIPTRTPVLPSKSHIKEGTIYNKYSLLLYTITLPAKLKSR